MKTYMAKTADVTRQWWLVDAENQVVGRLAAQLARVLMGKHRPTYTPHVDTGDFVVVINAEKVRFTGKKWETKQYERYSGYPGGRRLESAGHLLQRKPEEILRHAVRLMLPKNKLATKMLGKLKVYAGNDHPHHAQQPEVLELKS
jgi:large subunit ribosomal protein L13